MGQPVPFDDLPPDLHPPGIDSAFNTPKHEGMEHVPGAKPVSMIRDQVRRNHEAAKEGVVRGLQDIPADIAAIPGDLADMYMSAADVDTARPRTETNLGERTRETVNKGLYGDRPPLADPNARAFEALTATIANPTNFAPGESAAMASRAVKGLGRAAAEGVERAVQSGHPLAATLQPLNVVKEKGGNWIQAQISRPGSYNANTVESALRGLKKRNENAGRDFDSTIRDMEEYLKVAKAEALHLVPQYEHGLGTAKAGKAINGWIDKQLTRYVKNEMATKQDPIRALAEEGILHVGPDALNYDVAHHGDPKMFVEPGQRQVAKSDLAKRWEGASDISLGSERVGDFEPGHPTRGTHPWMDKVDPETRMYMPSNHFSIARDLGFDHLIDELHNAVRPDSDLPRELRLTPEKLNNVSVPDAVKLVDKINKWREAQKVEASQALANNPATHVIKEYPDTPELPNPKGLRWVELKTPPFKKFDESNLPEGYSLTSDARKDGREIWSVVGPNAESELSWTNHPGLSKEKALQHFNDWARRSQDRLPGGDHLKQSLKYEGDTMGHCVGGYCEDVAAGSTRIFSLRDAKGQPHVTVELVPSKPGYKDAELRRYNQDVREGKVDPDKIDFDIWQKSKAPQDIVQIKGKANKKPNSEYLPFVQDFVQNGDYAHGGAGWGEIGDLHNTDLIDVRKSSPTHLASTLTDRAPVGEEFDAMVERLKAAKESGALKPYMTKAQLAAIAGLGAAGAASAATGESMPSSNAVPLNDLPPDLHPDTMQGGGYETDQHYAPPQRENPASAPANPPATGLTGPIVNAGRRIGALAEDAPPEGLGSALLGAAEAPLAMASGLYSTAVSGLAGGARTAYGLATGEGLDKATQKGADIIRGTQKSDTYQPRTAVGKLINDLAGQPLELASAYAGKTGGAIGGAMGNEALGQTIGENLPAVAATGYGGVKAAKQASKPLPSTKTPQAPPNISSIGMEKRLPAEAVQKAKDVAEQAGIEWERVPEDIRKGLLAIAADAAAFDALDKDAMARKIRYESLPVPVKQATKGEYTRDAAQLRTESILRGTDQGKPLREIDMAQDEALTGSLDALLGKTRGFVEGGELGVGKRTTAVLEQAAKNSNNKVRAAYKAATESGEMQAPIDVNPLVQYLNDHVDPTQVSYVESRLLKKGFAQRDKEGNLVPGKQATLEELEAIRKAAVRRGMSGDGTAGYYAGEVKRVIDSMTDGAGGDAYKAARAERVRHALQFEEPEAVSRLLKKSSRTDRQVDLENVWAKTVNGSVDDINHVRERLLKDPDPKTRAAGRQAWADIQAQTIQFLKDKATASIAKNERGQATFSAGGYHSALQKIGRDNLETLLGKAITKQLYDIDTAAADLKTAPSIKVRGSDTVANQYNMLSRLEQLANKTKHVPSLGTVSRVIAGGAAKMRSLAEAGEDAKRVEEAATAKPEDTAKPTFDAKGRRIKALGNAKLPAYVGAEEAQEENK